MKNYNYDQKCLNCEIQDYLFTRGYCTKCYPLILKIEKIEKGILPNVFKEIEKIYGSIDKSKKYYIGKIQYRLRIIKEAHTLRKVTPHELESRINNTLKVLNTKSLGKFNDPIASYLKDDRARSYVYQLFTKMQLLKPLKVNSYDLYDAEARRR